MLQACAHRRAVEVEALLQNSGQHAQPLGHLTLQAANQSLVLVAHGCQGALLSHMESTMTAMGSRMRAQLEEKIWSLDEHVRGFQNLVQPVGTLDTAACCSRTRWGGKLFRQVPRWWPPCGAEVRSGAC
ncbi:hypothetical protein A6R68_02562, partial [Neotoma lepida]